MVVEIDYASAMQAFGWGPVWAAGSRAGVEAFPLLGACTLTIFADADGQPKIRPGVPATWADADRGP